MSNNPATEAVIIHLAAKTRAELDTLAHAVHRDRDALIADAVAAYLDVNCWPTAQVEGGLRQAENGIFATDLEVGVAFAAFK